MQCDDPSLCESVEHIVEMADKAMYQAKKEGKNAVVLARYGLIREINHNRQHRSRQVALSAGHPALYSGRPGRIGRFAYQ